MSVPLLPVSQFLAACAALPLVSIDFVITNAAGELLLGKRRNSPARNSWFTPGGRIRKNEALIDAKSRIANEELGLPKYIWERATLMGAWDHFYDDSAFDSSTPTHYINLPHWVQLNATEQSQLQLDIDTESQHSSWRWLPPSLVISDFEVHHYVRPYAQWLVSSSG